MYRQVQAFRDSLDDGFRPYAKPNPLTPAEKAIKRELALNSNVDYVIQSHSKHDAVFYPVLGASIAGPIPARDETGCMLPSDLGGSFSFDYEQLHNYWMTLGEATHLYEQAFQIAQMLREYSDVELPLNIIPIFIVNQN